MLVYTLERGRCLQVLLKISFNKMTRIESLIFTLTFLIVTGCGSEKAENKPDHQVVSEKLTTGTWVNTYTTFDAVQNSIFDGIVLEFTSNSDFTGGTYEVTGMDPQFADIGVWNEMGTWSFEESQSTYNTNTLIRGDGISMVMSLNVNGENDGFLSFNFSIPSNAGLVGGWRFDFELQ